MKRRTLELLSENSKCGSPGRVLQGGRSLVGIKVLLPQLAPFWSLDSGGVHRSVASFLFPSPALCWEQWVGNGVLPSEIPTCPRWCGTSSPKPKSCTFESRSGHIPRLRVPSPVKARMAGGQSMFSLTSMCFPPSLPPSLSVYLKINKHMLRRGLKGTPTCPRLIMEGRVGGNPGACRPPHPPFTREDVFWNTEVRGARREDIGPPLAP